MTKQSKEHTSLHSKKFVQELLTTLHHEIRNDITNIQSNAYFLSRKIHPQNSETDEYMLKINKKVDKILRQINEMSDVFQITNKTLILNKDTFNIILVLQEIGALIKKLYPKHILTITTTGDKSIMVNGDKQRIEMILKRLISHTNEHSTPGSNTGIELLRQDHHLEIAIWPYEEDKKEHHQKPVNDPISQKKFPVLNIELAIYEEILKEHKGTIQMVRTVTGDLAFFIMLPLQALPS